jgi:hypothetical protein
MSWQPGGSHLHLCFSSHFFFTTLLLRIVALLSIASFVQSGFIVRLVVADALHQCCSMPSHSVSQQLFSANDFAAATLDLPLHI